MSERLSETDVKTTVRHSEAVIRVCFGCMYASQSNRAIGSSGGRLPQGGGVQVSIGTHTWHKRPCDSVLKGDSSFAFSFFSQFLNHTGLATISRNVFDSNVAGVVGYVNAVLSFIHGTQITSLRPAGCTAAQPHTHISPHTHHYAFQLCMYSVFNVLMWLLTLLAGWGWSARAGPWKRGLPNHR